MASVYATSCSMEFVSIQYDTCMLPPVENIVGELMFTPTVVATVGSSIEHNSLSFENWIMLASGITISPLAIGVKLWSGAFMSYIPLYLALIPIVYWVLKIASAFVVSRYAHPKSISYLVKDEGGRQVTEKRSFSNGENFLDATLSVFRRKEHRDGKR